ncbi:hypothetical protein ACHAPT_009362 [Fusarium lateritium]
MIDMEAFQAYSDFLDALPYIASFRNLESFHLRFGTDQEEASIIREGTLGRVFHYLARVWPEHEGHSFNHPFLNLQRDEKPPTPVQLKTLTISNLDDSINTTLVNSEAFQVVTSSPSLVDLRLYLAADAKVLTQPSSTKSLDKLETFDTLPYTWLRPSVASNLHVLSLYCHNPWGWFPKMDFRLVGAGDGMPNLKVLALGNYTFSHEWQVEWIGSLGVQKLYLDGCAVLFQASRRRGMVMDQSETVLQGSDGRVHHFSNSGYYVKPTTSCSGNSAEAIHGTVRWHHLLSHWAKSMTNLRVFKMGKGHWDDIPNEAINPSYYESLHGASSQEAASQPFKHHGFRYFECPSPGTTGSGIQRYGTGASQDDEDMLKYVYWTEEYVDYDEMWERRSTERSVMAEEQWCRKYGQDEQRKLTNESRSRDRAALDMMISAADSRRADMSTSQPREQA